MSRPTDEFFERAARVEAHSNPETSALGRKARESMCKMLLAWTKEEHERLLQDSYEALESGEGLM